MPLVKAIKERDITTTDPALLEKARMLSVPKTNLNTLIEKAYVRSCGNAISIRKPRARPSMLPASARPDMRHAMIVDMKCLIVLSLGLVTILSSGCVSFGVRSGNVPSPTSGRTYAQVMDLAEKVVRAAPEVRAVQVSSTGSMMPYLGESSLVLLEPANGRSIALGSIFTYMSEGVEKIHIASRVTGEGIFAVTTDSRAEELVPFAQVTGRAMGVFFFDAKTVTASNGILTTSVAFAAPEGTQGLMPAALQVLGATMITEGDSVSLRRLANGVYNMIMPRGSIIRLAIGPVGAPEDIASSVEVSWEMASNTPNFDITDPANPGLGKLSIAALALR